MTTSTNIPRSFARLAGACAIGAILASGLAGCRGERSDKPPRQFLPDMDDSPKFKPQAEAPFFPDERSMRPGVRGTVPYGYTMLAEDPGRGWSLADDPAVFEGIDTARPADAATGQPAYHAVVPESVFERVMADFAADGRPMTRAQVVEYMLERGQERYNIYCSACHGYQGEGGGETTSGAYGGLVGRRWASPVPSYHDPKYRDRAVYTGQDGYLFSVIRHGVPNTVEGAPPKMPAYADKLSVRDSWAVVLYLRALQETRAGSLEGVPAEQRLRLQQSRPASSQSSIDSSAAGNAVALSETNP